MISNLGQITGELLHLEGGDRRQVERLFSRHGITAAEFDEELGERLDQKAIRQLAIPSAVAIMEGRTHGSSAELSSLR